MFKRLALLAVTAAVALVPVTVAHAGSTSQQANLTRLEPPCVLKKIKPPNAGPIIVSESPDVENEYADDDWSQTTVEHDGWVDHDDYTYPC